ncbi:hypothetical protein [Rossellomorea marisflavi]|uniref:hypothetical protein n=1 Tax=Rossellomorea marisflavi TaxID=189381 RepID=UPI003F9F4A58
MKSSKMGFLFLSSVLLVTTPLINLLPVSEVHAVADSFTLTKVGNDQISIQMNGTPQVQLPNGTIITGNTTFRVTENKTYTFVGIDGAVKVQKPFTMTTVPDTAPLLMVSPKENVFINFESGDAHSGVKDMRYVAYKEADGQGSTPFTSWESFKSRKSWTVPSIPAQTSAMWVVKAEFRDVAGNISTGVVGRFFIDNEAPIVSLNNTVTYTNVRDVDIKASISSKFKNPEEGFLSTTTTGPFESYTLGDLDNLYTGSNAGEEKRFEYELPYTLPATEGRHNVYFKATKQQHNQTLTSGLASKQIIYDKTPPTGTVVIDNGEDVVPSNEVNLTIKTADNLSGVDKIKIVEESQEGTVKEKVINNPSATTKVNWNLYVGDTAKVSVVVYDRAGNQTVIESQTVTFAKLSITAFELTNNRNPSKYHAGNPFRVKTWDWRGEDEMMLAGSSIDFKIYYDLGLGQAVDYNVTGEYIVEVKTADGSYNNVDKVKFDDDDGIVNGFSAEKVMIPEDAPKGAKVFISSNLEATRKTNSAIKSNATFAPAYVGTVGNTLSEEVNSLIEFNEIN